MQCISKHGVIVLSELIGPIKAEHREEVNTMNFNEHQARMLAEQRQREAEMKQRAYELEMKQGRHAQAPEGERDREYELEMEQVRRYRRPEGQEQQKAPKKKRGGWWRFWIGD